MRVTAGEDRRVGLAEQAPELVLGHRRQDHFVERAR
jgi:hypothetical protein